MLQIINSSAVLAYYQFDVDTGSHSVFSIDQPCGTLPGNSKLTLRVRFRPHHPIAHHKILTCLLLHRVGCQIHLSASLYVCVCMCASICISDDIQYSDVTLFFFKEPLFLDLIGTCHSELLKPAILNPRHLTVYRINLLRGLTCYPPDVLSAMLEEHKLKLDDSGALQVFVYF